MQPSSILEKEKRTKGRHHKRYTDHDHSAGFDINHLASGHESGHESRSKDPENVRRDGDNAAPPSSLGTSLIGNGASSDCRNERYKEQDPYDVSRHFFLPVSNKKTASPIAIAS